ncbi:MAG TPA: STAS domain-containing protein [Candidatus Cybelea sp.]|nr:STAS domain-containing protein [Candidatus Cybelea sp.]
MALRSHALRRVELDGEYDLSRKEEVAALFARLAPGGAPSVDMSKVTYIDSTFLHELALLHFRFKDFPVTLINVRPNVKRILDLVRFDRLFRFAAEPDRSS